MEKISQLITYNSAIIGQLRKLVVSIGWTEAQIEGQLTAIKQFVADRENGLVVVIENKGEAVGFISAQYYPWNRLGQIHGLLVAQTHRRQGFASKLIVQIEEFMKRKGGRGLYVDTPMNNLPGRQFYQSMGFRQDYIMTEYYDENSDGVTYLKLFKWQS